MALDKNKKGQKEAFYDTYWSSFHGFDLLEREFRADGWFCGQSTDFIRCKEKMAKNRPRCNISDRYRSCTDPFHALYLLRDMAMIVHGPVGCGHIFYTCSLFFPDPNRAIVCTQMDKNDALMGGEKKLKEAVREIALCLKPGFIAVIGTCTASIIAEDLEGICETLERETGIPIMAFQVAGFRNRTWDVGADEAFIKLIDRMVKAQPAEVRRGSINFLNLVAMPQHWKEFYELLPYFVQLGIKINTHTPCFISFQELIQTFPKAELNVVRCPGAGYQAAEYAEKILGIPYFRLPKPISLKYTEDFIRTIAGFFGHQKEAEDLIQREKKGISPHWERLRERLKGKRIALSAGPGKLISYAQLAAELGMEVVYLSSYKVDTLLHELLEDWCKSWGCDPIIMTEPSFYQEETLLVQLKPDLFIAFPEQRPHINQLNIPTIDCATLSVPELIGFKGALNFARNLVLTLENRLLRNWGRYLWKNCRPLAGVSQGRG